MAYGVFPPLGKDALDIRGGPCREEEHIDHERQNDEGGREHLSGPDQKIGGAPDSEDHADIPAAKCPGEPSSFARLHENDDDQEDADQDLK